MKNKLKKKTLADTMKEKKWKKWLIQWKTRKKKFKLPSDPTQKFKKRKTKKNSRKDWSYITRKENGKKLKEKKITAHTLKKRNKKIIKGILLSWHHFNILISRLIAASRLGCDPWPWLCVMCLRSARPCHCRGEW